MITISISFAAGCVFTFFVLYLIGRWSTDWS